jgi:hypothetical protein
LDHAFVEIFVEAWGIGCEDEVVADVAGTFCETPRVVATGGRRPAATFLFTDLLVYPNVTIRKNFYNFVGKFLIILWKIFCILWTIFRFFEKI